MKSTKVKFVLSFIIIMGFGTLTMHAQLGFCGGSSGNPIFTETFGSGTTAGPELAAGSTTYQYTDGAPAEDQYTISSSPDFNNWISIEDHTADDTDGKALMVNAHISALELYSRPVTGLCENTTYEFSAWIINLNSENTCAPNVNEPINVRFEVFDGTNTIEQYIGETGFISANDNPTWEQFAIVFKTGPGQTSVNLKLRNWSKGGCGNDVAIDDIVLKTCGDQVNIANSSNGDEIVVCGTTNSVSTTLTATPDNSVFTNHAYQWQESTDENTWTDILAETSDIIDLDGVTSTTYYRVKLAEDAVNLSNDLCSVVSNTFSIKILAIPDAPTSDGNVSICEGETGVVSASTDSAYSITWYNAPTGGNILLENSTSYESTVGGTFYAEATATETNCNSVSRTAVTLTVQPKPTGTTQTLYFCQGASVTLSLDIENATYLWSTGETTPTIVVDKEDTYTVAVTNENGCVATSSLLLLRTDAPVLGAIKSDGPSIIVKTANTGDFEYSVDNINYQDSNTFEALAGGQYTIYVRDKGGCGGDNQDFYHLVVPKFFTPNADGANDIFRLEGLENFSNVEFSVYDRYGNLIKQDSSSNPSWDGMYNGNLMPNADYWYRIKVDANVITGHFTLKR